MTLESAEKVALLALVYREFEAGARAIAEEAYAAGLAQTNGAC